MNLRQPLSIVASLLLILLIGCGAELPTSPGPSFASGEISAQNTNRRRVTSPVREMAPQCAAPAPFHKFSCVAPGYVVVYKEGTNAEMVTAQLEAKYGFRALAVWQTVPAFAALLSVQAVAALRCEPTIWFVEENAKSSVFGSPCG